MPEIWVPYGDVETLLTIQAENLGEVVEPQPDAESAEDERLVEAVRSSKSLFVCDAKPATVEFLRKLLPFVVNKELAVSGPSSKRLESALPELKGLVSQTSAPEGGGVVKELAADGRKTILACAQPDPLFGVIDAKVAGCLCWLPGSKAAAAKSKKDFEPAPFQKTRAYDSMERASAKLPGASFATVIPRAGRLRSVLLDPPFDAVANGFYESKAPQAKGMIVGVGGKGYDDTLSGALRLVWSAVPGVKASGEMLLIAECSEGLGSRALEMLVTGRLTPDSGQRREEYVDGLEEAYYLEKLKEEHDVVLLSGLPVLYAKSKLGLPVARGSSEALGRLLTKLGRTGKVNLVTRAAESRLQPS